MINVSTNDLMVDYLTKANVPLEDIIWYLSLKEPRDMNVDSASERGKAIYQKLRINTQSTSIASMIESGVPTDEVLWYFKEARPRNFQGDGDAPRARQIFKNVLGWDAAVK